MGLLDAFKKKQKARVTLSAREPSTEEMRMQWEEESIQRAKGRVRNFQKDEAGLYPHEILMLYYSEFYNINQSDFPQFWHYEYAVNDPMALLRSLMKRGFIREATATESLSRLKTTELKEILTELGLKTAGKKEDLISRIKESANEAYLIRRVKERRFARTESGERELEINAYIPYMHSHKFADISMSDMCILVNKNPNRPFRDILWSEFNRLSGEYMEEGRFGEYRNIRYTMYQFLMEENRTAPAFSLLAETIFYDLNGQSEPFIAPALVNNLRTVESVLDYSDERIIEILSNLFKGIYAPVRRFTNNEVTCIIAAYMTGHDEIAEDVFSRKAVK